MQVTDFATLVTNVGFPVTLCFILIRYVLQTIVEKLDSLDESLNQLTEVIHSLKMNESEKKDQD
ncbi:hypothetical protein ABER99_21235 [Paenibacillus glucanolyticus]|jgi:hypothetical protein|uniref:YvrJ family protein n=1 Tax=Paenibacillus glucanolyticus TaxID=59843 RepID=A0A163G808_9BACL|nr:MULTISPECIES: hypothetical protein [Paenibacillus]KZS44784.1 hypothetical protein AWU65_01980 [Paenibacillus glucanolyticus]MDH6675691.1 hypothetical protein [Paenibacillus sp. LBL]OMF64449.1 hypothetical protein BK142_31870 [Paenibacillus glucanolyticus]